LQLAQKNSSGKKLFTEPKTQPIMMWSITIASLLVAGAFAGNHDRDLIKARIGNTKGADKALQQTLAHLHDKAPETHLRGQFWEVNRRLRSSKHQLAANLKEEARKASILSHPDAQAVFVQEQAEQQQLDALSGKHHAVTGMDHSNPDDTDYGVLREPDLEGPGVLEDEMERENEGEDAQADLNEEDAEDAGVEPEVVPVKNVDGEGWFVDDKLDFHNSLDEAVAARRHDIVKMGRVKVHQEARHAQKEKEKKTQDEDDQSEARDLVNEEKNQDYA